METRLYPPSLFPHLVTASSTAKKVRLRHAPPKPEVGAAEARQVTTEQRPAASEISARQCQDSEPRIPLARASLSTVPRLGKVRGTTHPLPKPVHPTFDRAWLHFVWGPKRTHPVCFSHIYIHLDHLNLRLFQPRDHTADPVLLARGRQHIQHHHFLGADSQLDSNPPLPAPPKSPHHLLSSTKTCPPP